MTFDYSLATVEILRRAFLADANKLSVTSGFTDSTGVTHGFINNGGAPQICSQPYLQAMSEGDISGHTLLTKNGYNGTLSSSEQTLWAVGGDYVYPAILAQTVQVMEQ